MMGIGTNENPSPPAASSEGPRTSAANVPPLAGARENHASPAAMSSRPHSSTGLAPNRVTAADAPPAARVIPTASGREAGAGPSAGEGSTRCLERETEKKNGKNEQPAGQ